MEVRLKGVVMNSITRTLDVTRNERGATAVEYGLLVALIAAVIIVVVQTLGTQIAAAFQTVVDQLAGI